jgi:predicted RNA-binding protein with PUA-like domain
MATTRQNSKMKRGLLVDNNDKDENNSQSKIPKLSLLIENTVADESPNYWLMKSEPESRFVDGVDMKFSFNDLINSKNQTTSWDGVRNYEARNHLKKMRINEKAFFYHSNCKTPGIIGLVTVCKEAYVDHTQFDSKDTHFDPKSTKNNPKWLMVDVKFDRSLKRFISLSELKSIHLKHKSKGNGELINLSLFTRSRLSIQPINEIEWNFIISLENNQITNEDN